MRPVLVPARAGWGDAVTGISRADSASANAAMLRHRFVVCNGSGRLRQGLVRQRAVRLRTMSALLTAGFGEPRNGSLTTAARSCVRGAARATVDKSLYQLSFI
jgi:hypothetical protein